MALDKPTQKKNLHRFPRFAGAPRVPTSSLSRAETGGRAPAREEITMKLKTLAYDWNEDVRQLVRDVLIGLRLSALLLLTGCASASYNTKRYQVPCNIPPTAIQVRNARVTDTACSSTTNADPGVDQFQEGSYAAGCFHAEKDKADVTVSVEDFWKHFKHEIVHLLDVYCLKPGAKPSEATAGAGKFSPAMDPDASQEQREAQGIEEWKRDSENWQPNQEGK